MKSVIAVWHKSKTKTSFEFVTQLASRDISTYDLFQLYNGACAIDERLKTERFSGKDRQSLHIMRIRKMLFFYCLNWIMRCSRLRYHLIAWA